VTMLATRWPSIKKLPKTRVVFTAFATHYSKQQPQIMWLFSSPSRSLKMN